MFAKSLTFLVLIALAAAGHHDFAKVDSMQQAQVTKLYNSIFTDTYNHNVRPYGVNGTEATFVTVKAKDIRVIHVDENKGTFTYQAYYKKSWVDPRLAYNDTSISHIPIRNCTNMWYPNIYSENVVQTGDFPMMSMKAIPKHVRVLPTGRVYAMAYGTKTVYCPHIQKKDLKEFTCPVTYSPFAAFDDEIQLSFYDDLTKAVTVAKDVYLPKYTFGGVTPLAECTNKHADDHGHKHSCIQLNFKFTRA